jgi:hypothetical protein
VLLLPSAPEGFGKRLAPAPALNHSPRSPHVHCDDATLEPRPCAKLSVVNSSHGANRRRGTLTVLVIAIPLLATGSQEVPWVQPGPAIHDRQDVIDVGGRLPTDPAVRLPGELSCTCSPPSRRVVEGREGWVPALVEGSGLLGLMLWAPPATRHEG